MPRPSAASTEADAVETVAEPSAIALKVTVTRFDFVVNGDGLPPPKSMVPAEFENVGSVVHSEKTDPVFDNPVTASFVLSKLSLASTAFTLFPCGFVWMVTVNDCPTEYEPVLGEIEISAACVISPQKKSNVKATSNFKSVVVIL